MKKILSALLILVASVSYANAANEMIAVRADIVEISGTIQKTRGFQWNTFFDFTESAIKSTIRTLTVKLMMAIFISSGKLGEKEVNS